jgi:hypothetical protein
MPFSRVLRRVALLRTDVSEEHIASIIRVKRICELVTYNVPSSPILVTLLMETVRSSETLVTRATRRNIPEDGILHSHCPENCKSYLRKYVFFLFLVLLLKIRYQRAKIC